VVEPEGYPMRPHEHPLPSEKPQPTLSPQGRGQGEG
jgi:hypothetical protein